MNKKDEIVVSDSEKMKTALFENSVELIQYVRNHAVKQVNFIQLITFYSIGKWIVDEQQNGNERAKYGKKILKQLSEELTEEFGRGFSEDTLQKNSNVYAAEYKLYLPDKKLLQDKLKEWISEEGGTEDEV